MIFDPRSRVRLGPRERERYTSWFVMTWRRNSTSSSVVYRVRVGAGDVGRLLVHVPTADSGEVIYEIC